MRKLSKIRKLVGCCLLFFHCLILGGCWDRREMEERHFVLAAGIDLADAGLKPGQNPDVTRTETFVQPHGSKRYRLSLQILDISPSGGGGGDSGSKGGGTKTYVISNTGESLFEMNRDMLGQISNTLWWEHVQTLIISEAVVKEIGLKQIFDWFLRNHEMRWRIKVLITPGEARPLLEYQPPTGEPGGIYLANIVRNHPKSGHISGARTDLGFASQALDNNADIFLPRVEMVDDVVKISSIAAFKKDKFVGYFDNYANKGGKFIVGTEKSALITINCPDHPENVCVFELYRHDTRLKPQVVDGNISFNLDIAMIGNLAEMQCPSTEHNTQDPKYIRSLEILFAEEVKRSALYSWHTMQSLRVDSLRLGAKLQAHEPKTWEKVKDQWNDTYLPNVPLNVSVNVTIRGVGEHK